MRIRGALALSLWGLALAAAGLPASALAASPTGTYTVNTCAASTSSSINGWAGSVRSPAEPIEASSFCSGTLTGGVVDSAINFSGAQALRPSLPVNGKSTVAPAGTVASLTLKAPTGSTLTHITYHRKLISTDPAWDVNLSAGSTVIDDCQAADLQTPCPDSAPGGVFSQDLPAGTTSLVLSATCVAAYAPCTYPSGVKYTFGAAIYSASVTVKDTTAPLVSAITPSKLSNGWVGPDTSLSVTGSDLSGVKDLQLYEGGTAISSLKAPGCVDWSPQPCGEPLYSASTDLKQTFRADDFDLTDGDHTLIARATDAAGNTTDSAPLALKVDRTAPDPISITGDDISAAENRSLSWSVEPGGSPLVSASVEVCTYDQVTHSSPGCVTSVAPPTGPFAIDMTSVLSSANVSIKVTDQAGNVGEADDVFVGRDAVAPPKPSLAASAVTGTTRSFIAATSDDDAAWANPRLCQGNTCTDLKPVQVLTAATTIVVTPPGPGDYRLEVRMADPYGNQSDAATITFNVPAGGANFGVVGAGVGSTVGANGLTGQVIKIVPVVPTKLSGSTILIKGAITPGSASSVSVSLAGRLKNGKSSAAVKAVVPAPNGKFAVRLRLASKLNRSKGVLLTIAAVPNAGYALAKVRVRVKG